MGILHSSCRAIKEEDDDDEIPIYPNFQNHYISSSPEPLLLQTPPPISSPTTFGFDDEENYLSDEIAVEENGDAQKSAEEETVKSVVEELMRWIIAQQLINSREEEKRIKHYSSSHMILLVGEGDFSFSACLAVAFGSAAANIIATSLDSRAFLKKHYGNAMSNIAELKSRGSKVMHGIDATGMANHKLLPLLKFDRIIFNFPYAGFFPRESTQCQLRRHRKLVSRFLMNAKKMISENGEIHISHKTNGFFHAEFKVVSIASSHGLRLIEAVKFKCGHYPGYNTKYGFGGDKNFNPYPSKTFKFGLKTLPNGGDHI